MEYVVVAIVALVVSGLTLYSGFGLGTLLMPVFALFFPVEVAIAATAVVHGANNVFKIGLVGKHANKHLVLAFGIPAIIAAFFGASALGLVSGFTEITRYSIGTHTAVVTPVKLLMGVLMLIFAVLELAPRFRELRFERRHLLLGGILSGFFGGFSGHQGALRSAFLVKAGVSTEEFVGTNAVIGFMVDAIRILTYAGFFLFAGRTSIISTEESGLILVGVLSAFAGVLIGKQFLKKIKITSVQTLTGIFLIGIALALGLGIV